VYDGTLPTQETLAGTIDDVRRALEHTTDRRPALLIVGRVAALREHLRWFDARPLFGRRILVTRPREQARELVERLEALGAQPVEAPLIRIAPPDDWGPLDEACADPGRFDWIIFSSANAVESFMQRLLSGPQDLRALGRVRLAAVGSSTGERLARYGIKVDLVPSEFRAEAILPALSDRGDVAGLRVLLPRADIGREVVADELRRHGADVTEVIAYKTVVAEPEREGEPDIYRMLLDRRIDVVTFTSPSAVRSFVQLLGVEPAVDLLRTTLVASIGPVTAEAATQYGIETNIMPGAYTVPALVAAIAEHFARAGNEQVS
jgi:uroporphyrinogen III methyltransferase/synthase